MQEGEGGGANVEQMEGRISFRFARPIRRITDALLRVVEDGPQLQGKILFESVGCQPAS